MSEHGSGNGAGAPWPPTERRRSDDRRRPKAVRIAAVGDFHCGEEDAGRYRELFARANDEADVLVLAGDLTRRGTPAEMRVVCGELADVKIPIVTVFGNHDHEAGEAAQGGAILRDRGVHLLESEPFELWGQVGFAGCKGYMGGFGRWTLTAFGEQETKDFVGRTLEEVQRLEFGLRRLATPVRVAVLHYAPTLETVVGEPEQIFPFLGNDRLAEPLDRFRVAVAFHGHAHHGTFRGATPGGVPVFNVSHTLIRKEGVGEMYFRYDIPLPAEDDAPAGGEPGAEAVGAGSGAGVSPSAPGSA